MIKLKSFYITAPLFYPNAELHLGHIYTVLIADIIARYKREQNYQVFFLVGMDEHGKKIYQAASKLNLNINEYLNLMAFKFEKLWKTLKIDYQLLIRTSDVKHQLFAKDFFYQLKKNDYLHFSDYQSLYCESCSEFINLKNSQTQEQNLKCLNCFSILRFLSEKAYFLKINREKQWLLNIYNQNDLIYPLNKKNELISNFINNDLKDLSITRLEKDFWGIELFPFSNEKKFYLYVWIDALCGYISLLKREENKVLFKNIFQNQESEFVQVIGKDILRFHGIYWLILLKIFNLKLPNKLIVHGWLTVKDQKMSKSIGNVIDPYFLIKKYGVDASRICLMQLTVIGKDFNFDLNFFHELYNNLLVNNFGNFFTRVITMVNKYYQNFIPFFQEKETKHKEKELILFLKKTINSFCQKMDTYQIYEAINLVFKLINQGNKFIDLFKPWDLFKNKDFVRLNNVINLSCNLLKISAFLLKFVLISTSEKIFNKLNIKSNEINLFNLEDWNFISGREIIFNQDNYLFKRIIDFN
jgi:methionyl-tRNA synthetase